MPAQPEHSARIARYGAARRRRTRLALFAGGVFLGYEADHGRRLVARPTRNRASARRGVGPVRVLNLWRYGAEGELTVEEYTPALARPGGRRVG